MTSGKISRVPLVKLTELRTRIGDHIGTSGPYVMYKMFSLKGWIPKKRDGEPLDVTGFIRAYNTVRKDREVKTNDMIVRFLHRAAVAASRESRGHRHTVREVKNMLGLHEATVKDILINYGDI